MKMQEKKVLKLFCEELAATKAAKILGFNCKTVDHYYNIFRQKIFEHSQQKHNRLKGEIEVDESYFGAQCIGGKRGRGAAGKTPVFGILNRDGKVTTSILKNCSKEELMPIIKG